MNSRITRRGKRRSSRYTFESLSQAVSTALNNGSFISGEYTETKGGAAEASCERENSTERNADGNTRARSVHACVF